MSISWIVYENPFKTFFQVLMPLSLYLLRVASPLIGHWIHIYLRWCIILPSSTKACWLRQINSITHWRLERVFQSSVAGAVLGFKCWKYAKEPQPQTQDHNNNSCDQKELAVQLPYSVYSLQIRRPSTMLLWPALLRISSRWSRLEGRWETCVTKLQ